MQGLVQSTSGPSSLEASGEAEHRIHHAARLLSAREKAGKDTILHDVHGVWVAAQQVSSEGDLMADHRWLSPCDLAAITDLGSWAQRLGLSCQQPAMDGHGRACKQQNKLCMVVHKQAGGWGRRLMRPGQPGLQSKTLPANSLQAACHDHTCHKVTVTSQNESRLTKDRPEGAAQSHNRGPQLFPLALAHEPDSWRPTG